VKLYSGPLSLFTAKVRIALAEKGLAYERIEVGWSLARRYEPHHPDVVALNPKRQVPVLVDGDVVVCDSTLIFEYLEDRYPQPALHPADPAGRARSRQLEAAADEILFPHVWELIDGGFYPAGAAGRDGKRIERARAGIEAYRAERARDLAGREWLAGPFGYADIANVVMLQSAASLGAPPVEAHPALQAWEARMRARPAVARELAEMQAFAARALSAPAPAAPEARAAV
jgi:glutathione S-transferase